MSGGIDKGYCLEYFQLSYRRKFIRTLWLLPFSFIMLVLPYPHWFQWLSFCLTLVLGLVQGVYSYRKWQAERHTVSPKATYGGTRPPESTQ